MASKYFISILGIIIVMQIIVLTLTGKAIRVAKWGLDPLQWLLCIAIGSISLLWSVILKFIPAERWIKVGAGSKPLSMQ